ncbi:MAG: 3'-5' exonuclease, partial [Gemmatimonadales bacterium]
APVGPARLTDCVFAVVDVETTGSRPANGDRITEIAIVIVKGGSCEPVYEIVVNPERSIPRKVTALTGITQADVASRPRFDEIAEQVRSELTGRIFAAHNVSFDWRFVASEMRRSLGFDLAGQRICTARLGRVLVSGLRSSSLDSLARYFGIEIQPRHRAGGDALATAKLLVRLLHLAAERGATTVDDLVRLTRRSRKRKKSAMPAPMKDV